LKKTQRQHSASGAERLSYCQCLDAVVPTHLTLNLAVMSSSAFFASSVGVLAEFGDVDRRQLCGHFAGTLHSSAVRMEANETEAARVDCPRHKQANKQTALSMGS
jgi:hypothetical protein